MARITSDIKQDTRMADDEPTMSAPSSSRSSGKVALTKKQLMGLMVLLVVLAGTSSWLGYKVWQGSVDPQAVAAAENKALVAEVGKIIVLPEGEDPTVATVNDLEPLKGQAFFEHAQIGDKVLIYTNARKAVLYNPGTNKIVEVAPVNIGNQDGQNTVTPAETTPATDKKKTEE